MISRNGLRDSHWGKSPANGAKRFSPPPGRPPLLNTHHAPRITRQPRAPCHQLSTLLWPHPTAWAGLAAVWLVILGVNLTTREASTVVSKRAAPVSSQSF